MELPKELRHRLLEQSSEVFKGYKNFIEHKLMDPILCPILTDLDEYSPIPKHVGVDFFNLH